MTCIEDTRVLVQELWRYIHLISQNKLCNFSGLFMHGRLFIRARKLIPLVTYEVSLIFCTSPQFFFKFWASITHFLTNSRPGLLGLRKTVEKPKPVVSDLVENLGLVEWCVVTDVLFLSTKQKFSPNLGKNIPFLEFNLMENLRLVE